MTKYAFAWIRSSSGLLLLVSVMSAALLCLQAASPRAQVAGRAPQPSASRARLTYTLVAGSAVTSLVRAYYNGAGLWRDCPESRCWVHNGDWGSDALTNTLWMHWKTTHDVTIPPLLVALSRTARQFKPPCRGARCLLWSDVPMWDSIAASHEHEAAPNDAGSLRKAVAAFWAVEGSPVYGVGACPTIRYQRPFGRGDRLKTLETDSNGVKAALLLYDATRDARYLRIAQMRYRAIRHYFLDARVPLYSVYVFDDGAQCTQVAHRFFASVNGNMIWNGIRLARVTGAAVYRDDALATARAVARYLNDPSGVFANLQAENDVEEPLVEAMSVLATTERQAFARRWLLTNASAAYSARKADGTYGRFFDGPPPAAAATAWQTNGGVATEIAAAELDPGGVPRAAAWSGATFVPHPIARLPATIPFVGSGIALIGTLGDVCCQAGHARVFVDGVETMNHVGAWQNKSSSGRRYPGAILFAWRWRENGRHSITLLPGDYNAKEGGSFLRAGGYSVIGTAVASVPGP